MGRRSSSDRGKWPQSVTMILQASLESARAGITAFCWTGIAFPMMDRSLGDCQTVLVKNEHVVRSEVRQAPLP
jgi:hypothetical protein